MSKNTSSIDTQRTLRIEKINTLRSMGIEPYPVNSTRDFTLYEVSNNFNNILSQSQSSFITLAGRVKTKRGSGKIGFIVLEDESLPSGFQAVLKIDELPEDSEHLDYSSVGFSYKQFKKYVDEGDYIQVKGYLGATQTGQESIFAKDVRILSKCIRPLPDILEYQNTEARYLDRTADYKMNTIDPDGRSVRDYVRARETYWRIWREEMLKEGFTECYNNVFETKPAGADAKPFTTYYNELSQDVYLRMALEIPLKKLVAGGFEKVFEIGRIFRNEGSSPSHLQDYTQIEWYWAYSNYYDAMPFTVRIYRRIAQEILGTLTQKTYSGESIDWGAWCSDEEAQKHGWNVFDGWPAIPYFEAIRYFTKTYYPQGEVDLEHKTYEELLDTAKEHGVDYDEGINISNLLDKIYKKIARPYMTHPFFLTEQPTFLEPLAKRSPQNPDRVHRWQIVAGGAELGKCFSELNDPLDQFSRLKEQQDAKDRGDEEAQFLDEEFVKAMEYGMPPMSGFGMSERLISFLLGKHIREVATYPYVRDNTLPTDQQIQSLLSQKEEIEKRLHGLGYANNTKNIQNKENPLTDNLHEIDPDEIVNHFGEDTILEYWSDSFMYSSTAKVVLCSEDEKGKYIVLDKTIFYPQGGGQPSDIGEMQCGPLKFLVTKCAKEGGVVKHYGEGDEISQGSEVSLTIDKEKRTTHIFLHSAAHIIDFALYKLGLDVVGGKGYHFPAGPYCEYQYNGDLPDGINDKIQEKIDEIVKSDIRFIKTYKKTDEGSIIRYIQLENTSSICPCGGTHITSTHDIKGSIKIRGVKVKKGVLKVKYTVE